MEPTDAMKQTAELVTEMISQLTTDQREAPTPCKDWSVHDVINHMVGGADMVATVLSGEAYSPDPEADHLPDGPANGWAGAVEAMTAAAVPDNLAALRQAPFGEFPGSVLLSVIVADHLTHAWDVSKATGIIIDVSDELAEFAQQTWGTVIRPEFRDGNAFAAEQDCADDAPAIDKVAAFTGRGV